MSENTTILITIAYDQCLMAEGLSAIISKQKDIRVINLIENETFLKTKLPVIKADVLIVELDTWYSNHFGYIKQIRDINPNLKMIIVSEIITGIQLEALMQYIDGYIVRTSTAEKPVLAIREIFASGKYLCPKSIDIIFHHKNNHENNSELTLREKEILAGWMNSKSNNELALKLNISQSTVRTHLKNIRQKLGDATHMQLMNYACRQNILMGKFKPICINCKSFCNI